MKLKTSEQFKDRFKQAHDRIARLKGRLAEVRSAITAEEGFARGLIQSEADRLGVPDGSKISVSNDLEQIEYTENEEESVFDN